MGKILVPIDNSLVIFDESGTIKWKRTFRDIIKDCAISPDNKNMLIIFQNGDMDYYSVDGIIIRNISQKDVRFAKFLDNNKILVTSKSNITIRDMYGVILKTIKNL